MIQTDKHIDSIFTALSSSLPLPFLITTRDWKVVHANRKAAALLKLPANQVHFDELFAEKEHQKLLSLMEKIESSVDSLEEELTLTLADGESITARAGINKTIIEEEKYFLISLQAGRQTDEKPGRIHLSISQEDISALIHNPDVLAVIDEIKANYPFTFIGKGKLQRAVNELPELFWMKDENEMFSLVNNGFASLIGLKVAQVEGKSERNFLPLYLVDFYENVDRYLKDTKNYVVLEGIKVKGFTTQTEYQTIEIPLVDADNKVIAVIGIAQEKKEAGQQPSTDFGDVQASLFPELFRFPAAVCNAAGVIRSASKSFYSLFGIEQMSKGQSLQDLLPQNAAATLMRFFAAGKESLEIGFDLSDKQGRYQLKAQKLALGNQDAAEYFISIDADDDIKSFKDLLEKRGPMFDLLIKENPQPIFIYSTSNLQFLDVNNAALAMYGYSKTEFLQMDLTDLYSPEDIQTLLDSSGSDEGVFSGPYKHKKKDGSTIFVEISKIAFTYDDQEAHFNVIRDISQVLAMQRQMKEFEGTFEMTTDLIFFTDDTGFIRYVNPSVVETLGYAKDELIGNSLVSIISDENRSELTSGVFYSKSKEVRSFSVKLKTAAGEYIDFTLKARPVVDENDQTNAFTILAEKPPEKVEVVKEVPKEIIVEKEVDRGGKPVASGGLSPDQISYVFHELLTPINVILGFIYEIKDSIAKPTDDQLEAIEIIDQNREKLLYTMNSIAEFAQVESELEKINVETFRVIEILEDIQHDLQENVNPWKKQVLFGKVSTTLSVNNDRSKLRAFLSLIIKISFHISESNQLFISTAQRDASTFIITLKDSEDRVSDKLLDNLTSLFGDVDISAMRAFGMSRFSVYTSQKLLPLLQGSFETTMKSGKTHEIGFVFPIEPEFRGVDVSYQIDDEVIFEPRVNRDELPDAEPVREKEEQKKEQTSQVAITSEAPADAINLSELRCLYIEDQSDSQVLFKVQMKELKQLEFASGFEEAIPYLQESEFDFIVMDINLEGEYNGLDALKMIHKMPGLETIPIIAVTAYALPGDKEKFIAAGFSGFVSKPIFRDKVVEVLEKIF